MRQSTRRGFLLSLAFAVLVNCLSGLAVHPALALQDPGQGASPETVTRVRDALLNKLVEKYMGWKKAVDDNKGTVPGETKKDILGYPEFIKKVAAGRALKHNLTNDQMFQALELAFARFLLLVSPYLSDEEWCKLYSEYRGGKSSQYGDSKDDEWKKIDDLARAKKCKKPEEEKPTDKGKDGHGMKPEECPPGYARIENCSNAGDLQMELIGDGQNTEEIGLYVTDPKSGAIGVVFLQMICVSSKLHKPPPSHADGRRAGLLFTLGKADSGQVAIVKAARQLEQERAYDHLKMTNPQAQISQLAVWQQVGEHTPGTADDISAASVKEDIVSQAGIQPTPELDKALTERVNEILAAVDLTRKRVADLIAETPDETRQPPDATEPGPPDDGLKEGQTDQGLVSEPCTVICIPPFTVFDPNNSEFQKMMTVADAVLILFKPLQPPGSEDGGAGSSPGERPEPDDAGAI